MIYFDYNATTPLCDEARDAITLRIPGVGKGSPTDTDWQKEFEAEFPY